MDTRTISCRVAAMLRFRVSSALPASSTTIPVPVMEAWGVSSSTMVTVMYWKPRETGSKRNACRPKSDDSSSRVKVSFSSAMESPRISNSRGRV